jgi:SAM-dependent methyltransferase
MKLKTLDYYSCPECKRGRLQALGFEEAKPAEEIYETELRCLPCNESYAVRNGVPRFVINDNYADSFAYQWNLHRKTQLDSYTGLQVSQNRLFQVTGWPRSLEGQLILEVGSGAGRFTEVLLKVGATVFSFDYSSAVDANWSNNGLHPNLHLFQGDIYKIPIREAVFDKVLCLGVIQHTPNPEKAFKSLIKHLRPGGELVLDVYPKRLTSVLRWKYLLRPLTTRMNKERLYKIIRLAVPVLLPMTITLKRVFGELGARLMPIMEYSNLGLPYSLNKEWSILDTFDMYSPAHDHPQSISSVEQWFRDADLVDASVAYGPNGVVAKGRRGESAP